MLRYVSPVAEQTADVYWSGEALWICSVGAAIAASIFSIAQCNYCGILEILFF